MIYIFHLLDNDGVADLRIQIRPEHKAYLEKVADRIAFAGPLKNESEQMIGSLLAIDFSSKQAASAWIKDEPFTKAGVYKTIEINAFENLWEQKVGFPAKK